MRLIDADALIEKMKKVEADYEDAMTRPSWWTAYSVVSEQPTAYDVDAVVKELEYQKEYFEKDRTYWADHTWKDNVVYCNWDLSDKKVNCYESAIDIVKRGGVE